MGGGYLHLACVADAAYAPWCATMLDSAVASCSPLRPVVHLLHPQDMDPGVLRGIRGVVERGGGELRPSAISDEAIEGLPGTDYFPPIIWYRSLLPEMRPDLDRILYLDSDTLVTDSLVPLWETDLGSNRLAAVRNLVDPRFADQPQRVGVPADHSYFNSGVLLMDLAGMRREDSVRQLYEHANRYRGVSVWPDQDSLNFVFQNRALIIHPRWNCQNSFFVWPQAAEVFGPETLAEATTGPAILHFEGPPATKPWHYLSRHPYRDRYWHHLARTPFCPSRPEGRSVRNILTRHIPPKLDQMIRRGSSRARSTYRKVRT